LSSLRPAPSIRGRLLAWLMGAVFITGMTTTTIVYIVALHETDELFDYHIRQLALSLAAQSTRQDAPMVARPDSAGSEEFDFAVQIWSEDGTSLYLSPNYPELPARAVLGFSDIRDASGSWRVYATQWGPRTIQVVQPLEVRREMAFASAMRTLIPLLLLIPLLGVAVWLTVGRALRPLRSVVDAVERRSASALEPLQENGLPVEISPLVAALNRLLRRLEESIAAQRAFVGDAAHELRTPLAALRLQAQVLVRTRDESERDTGAKEFISSVDRATRLVEQLLDLARSEPDAAARAFVPVRLEELARDAVARHAEAAIAKEIDLGVSGVEGSGITVRGDPQALRILLGNLVDNAVRYTPPGGRVDVIAAYSGRQPTLSVLDTGQGIPPAERERVFDRFYRLPGNEEGGSGLGLAIVRRIANMHGARVKLESGAGGAGLRVSLIFPAEKKP